MTWTKVDFSKIPEEYRDRYEDGAANKNSRVYTSDPERQWPQISLSVFRYPHTYTWRTTWADGRVEEKEETLHGLLISVSYQRSPESWWVSDVPCPDELLPALGELLRENEAEVPAPIPTRSCNRHEDCAAFYAANPKASLAACCHDDECEDCFGQ